MNFNFFEQQISKIKDLPLPGEASQYKMAPESRLEELQRINISQKNPRRAGVMALFYPTNNMGTNLLLILRKTYKGVHSNQVAFPGGKEEKSDDGLLTTALRETYEEVGVAPKDITVIKEISEIFIPPSNFMVQPYIGLYRNPKPFVKQDAEVELILEVPVSDFLDDTLVVSKKMTTSYAVDIEVPAFKLNGYIVWGATAMMMNEIKELLKQVL
ncbi:MULTISPECIES: NUDIX hydrolase [Maribacter]|mgnify:FL=1|uniref:NUDIX domain-containing protein n=1 Tax=Maribacter dokdonensis TaxID=320912 RepID=A0ABY0U3M5_9FLAO|nr:CoA pyrophosphatase [Maribacter dokdonensis]MBU2902835.1 CoA pyrophosphatase [Maribacter dokdonensis]SDS01092.1 NUDIX domain-containing protein [Maribacter dokdonensis]|tara:strand:- start:9026 stop:9667 length:642 start_codon:yes stop_codon:yes gene_type:complete